MTAKPTHRNETSLFNGDVDHHDPCSVFNTKKSTLHSIFCTSFWNLPYLPLPPVRFGHHAESSTATSSIRNDAFAGVDSRASTPMFIPRPETLDGMRTCSRNNRKFSRPNPCPVYPVPRCEGTNRRKVCIGIPRDPVFGAIRLAHDFQAALLSPGPPNGRTVSDDVITAFNPG